MERDRRRSAGTHRQDSRPLSRRRGEELAGRRAPGARGAGPGRRESSLWCLGAGSIWNVTTTRMRRSRAKEFFGSRWESEEALFIGGPVAAASGERAPREIRRSGKRCSGGIVGLSRAGSTPVGRRMARMAPCYPIRGPDRNRAGGCRHRPWRPRDEAGGETASPAGLFALESSPLLTTVFRIDFPRVGPPPIPMADR